MEHTAIIENRKQLKVEILRLESLKYKQELIIDNNIRDIKEGFKLSNLIPEAISSLLAKKNGDEASTPLKLINMGVVYLAESLFLKGSPKLVKAAVAYALGNVTSNAIADKSTSILNGVRAGLKGVRNLFRNNGH
ncbi:MAG: hypothetical protein ACR2GN_07700 [Bacteroidia bacterium]